MHPLVKLFHEKSLSPGCLRALGITVLFLSTSTFAFAKPPPGGERGGPPKEAFTACEQSVKDDLCTVDTPKGELTGICRQDRRSDALLCVPNDKSERPEREKESAPEDSNN